MTNENSLEITAPAKKKSAYSLRTFICAWVTIAIFVFVIFFAPVNKYPLASVLFMETLFALPFIMGLKIERKGAIAMLAAGAAMSFSILFSSNAAINTCICIYSTFVYMYAVNYLSGASASKRFGEHLIADGAKAFIIRPFASIHEVYVSALKCGENEHGKSERKKVWKVVLWVLFGLLAAIIPTFIVISLLSYDEGFEKIIADIFSDFFTRLFDSRPIGRTLLGLICAAIPFGALMSAKRGRASDIITPDGAEETAKKVKAAPVAFVFAACLPLLAVYAIFFFSQWDYYMSAFTNKLPAGLTYSQYAREGFFQLLAVAAINAAIVGLIALFCKQNKRGKKTVLQRVTVLLLSASTLILIATAISKMAIYIGAYGLTRLRVYSSWFMIVLAFAFIIIIIKQFADRFPSGAAIIIAFTLLFAVIGFGGFDRVIADYNVDHYISGTLSADADKVTCDLIELGDEAAPALIRYFDFTSDTDAKTHIADLLVSRYDKFISGASNPLRFNIPRIKAIKEYKKWKENNEFYYSIAIPDAEGEYVAQKEKDGIFVRISMVGDPEFPFGATTVRVRVLDLDNKTVLYDKLHKIKNDGAIFGYGNWDVDFDDSGVTVTLMGSEQAPEVIKVNTGEKRFYFKY